METERKQSSWELKGEMLVDTMPDGTRAEFDMSAMFPMWDVFHAGQKFIASYGLKQFVSDRTNKTDDSREKRAEMYDAFEKAINGDVGKTSLRMTAKKVLNTVADIIADPDLSAEEKVALLKQLEIRK